MDKPVLYRKRLIPLELILLEKDIVLYRDDRMLITSWDTIRPKATLHHGFSAFFWDLGIKVSKFYGYDGKMICWYCDIITHEYQQETDTYITIDLLADVLVYPNGTVKVVDLDELSDAFEQGLITQEQLLLSLRQLNDLLTKIYSGHFSELTDFIEREEARL